MTGCWILSGFEKWSVGRFVLWCMGSIRVTYSDIVLDTFWDDGAELEGSFVYHFVTLLAICFVFSKWYSGARQLTWGGCGSGGTGIGGFLFLSYGLRCVHSLRDLLGCRPGIASIFSRRMFVCSCCRNSLVHVVSPVGDGGCSVVVAGRHLEMEMPG